MEGLQNIKLVSTVR